MLIDRRNLHQHLGWITFCVVITIAATAWYFYSYFFQTIGERVLPGGSSLPGFTFGVVGGVICVFEFLLWPRKKVRGWRIGRAQLWLRAHIWLGLLSLPLVILHTGFRMGGALSTTVLLLFLAVIISGVIGLLLQQFLPRRILEDVPSETIYSQIPHVSQQFAEEASRIIQYACGGAESTDGEADEEIGGGGSGVTIGAVRSAGRVQGKVLEKLVLPPGPIQGAESLRQFHEQHVDPYLREGERSGSALQFRDKATGLFQDLRGRIDPAAHSVIGALASLCEQRRQFTRQAQLHRWLHGWLWVHLPLSMALIFLLFVHVYVALKYW